MLTKLKLFQPLFARSISLTSGRLIHKINIIENEKETIVQGIPLESDRKQFLIADESKSQACALCRLNLKGLRYTDVLILSQFVDADGIMVSQKDSQLCSRQYGLVKRLILKAQQCRLLKRPPNYPVLPKWDEFNTYEDFPSRHRDNPWHAIQEDYWR